MSFDMSDMGGMLGKVQEMQAKMKTMQEELRNKTVETSAGGGLVKVTTNGKNEVVKINIDKSIVDADDVEMLEDLVKAAVNSGITKIQEVTQNEMGKLTGGMNIPGMDQLGNMFK